MIRSAALAGVPLAVGHTERFNPAIVAARPLITDPRFIEVHRLGDFSKRSLDIDVVFDLMIHDLDILVSIVKHSVESVEAVGVSVMSDRVDIANARVEFSNGCVANLTASRITVGDRDKLVRKIRFFQPAAYLSIDYKERTVEYLQRVNDHNGDAAIRSVPVDVSVDEEPLRRELADFIDSVRHDHPPAVSGEDGLAALALAERISGEIEATARVG